MTLFKYITSLLRFGGKFKNRILDFVGLGLGPSVVRHPKFRLGPPKWDSCDITSLGIAVSLMGDPAWESF